MFALKKHGILILIAILSTLFVNEIQACFTYNTKSPVPMLRKAGTNFFLSCYCEQPVMTSKLNLQWLDNRNIEIKGPGNGSKAYTEFSHRNLELYIEDLNKSQTGTYKCVSNGTDGVTYSQEYYIEVYEPLYFVRTNTTQYLISGQDSFIACEARGHNPPRISWLKGPDETMITNNEKYEILQAGLVIKNASIEDTGKYYCKATVIYTAEDETREINVEVYTPPAVADIIAIPNENIAAGENVTLDCKAGGYPVPKYTWRKISDNQTSQEHVTWEQDFNKITFVNITMYDQGIYECLAKNEAGEAKKNISIEVIAPPVIEGFENITVNEGQQVSVACTGIGRPPPYINITYYGDKSDSPPGYTTSGDESTYNTLNLTFEKVDVHHEGWYECNASNVVGSEQKGIYLQVNHKPHFAESEELVWAWDDKVVNLSCEHISQPKAEIQWSYLGEKHDNPTHKEVNHMWTGKTSKHKELHYVFTILKGMLYGTYECVAKNLLGHAKKVINVVKGFKPLAVNTVNITEIAATSATFDIKAPELSGPPLTGFLAEYDETENYKITNIHLNRTWAANNVPFKIEHLKPKTNYSIRFAAQNEVGTGPYGRYYTFETPEKSIPEPPLWDYNSAEPVLISTQNNKIKVNPPEQNGDPIDYFAVKYWPVDDPENPIALKIDPTVEIEIPDLKQNRSYVLEILAHNSVGNSTPTRLQIVMEAGDPVEEPQLTAGGIIAVSIVVVILAILIMDILLFIMKKQGMIAYCYHKKNKKKKEDSVLSKDKKGLLKDNGEAGDALKTPENGHKEFEYNKTTGVITGKHSAV